MGVPLVTSLGTYSGLVDTLIANSCPAEVFNLRVWGVLELPWSIACRPFGEAKDVMHSVPTLG